MDTTEEATIPCKECHPESFHRFDCGAEPSCFQEHHTGAKVIKLTRHTVYFTDNAPMAEGQEVWIWEDD